MSIIVVYSFFLKMRLISQDMPYSCHTDEKYIVEPALTILKTGDFNPHRFNYPSLPIYLAAMSFTVGYLNSAAHLEIKSTQDIEPNVYPYFKHPRIIWHARVVFTFLSALAMIFMALIAYRFYKNPFLLFGVPLVASLSYHYLLFSYTYLNVDTAATFFIFLVYWHLASTLKRDSFIHKAIVPGILSGLVLACKYNLFWIIVPAVLVILFYAKERKKAKILSLFLIMMFTFILVVPFSVLDFNTFLDWLAIDVRVYNTVGVGHSTTPGLPQLIYHMRYFFVDFGFGFSFLAFVGIIAGFFYDWKKGIILLSFPLLLLFHLSSYVKHYPRNIMSLFGIFAIFAALGVVCLYKLLYRLLLKFSRPRWPEGIKKTAVFLLLSIVLFFPVQKRLIRQLNIKPDSRNLAVAWITKKLEKKSNLIISEELAMYVKPLEKNYNIFLWEFEKLNRQSFYKKAAEIENPIVIMPVFRPLNERQPFAVKKAKDLNTIGNSLKMMQTFGRVVATLNTPVHVVGKDPKILIGTL
jgi:hypothetical protein